MSKQLGTIVAISAATILGLIVLFEVKNMNKPNLVLNSTSGGAFNNPLNIRKTAIKWGGEIDNPNSAFESFDTLANGYRAAILNLRTHYNSYGDDTLRKQISRWAPLGDGKNDPTIYTQTVTDYIRAYFPDFNPDGNIYDYLYSVDKVTALLSAMTTEEQGSNFTVYEDSIQDGFNLA